jgi:deoxyribodipyrimidine photo-lyase
MAREKLHSGDDLFPDMAKQTPQFPLDYNSILARINNIDAAKYARTRNFINGAVTYLSPYIARGVISLVHVKEAVMHNKKLYQVEKLLQELAWREYFQRIWQHYGDAIWSDIKQPQPNAKHQQLPQALAEASTGINAIDDAIETLYSSGYMHNHLRMYTAMLACNIGKAHWQQPSKWLYYHLLDGDIASNTLSWQWVAGSFSSKLYYANQENINKYAGTEQQTYLSVPYEDFATMPVPLALQHTITWQPECKLPTSEVLKLDTSLPILVYNSYNLDPLWHKDEAVNRVLLLEPSHFDAYPVSDKVIDFIIGIAKTNIPGVQVFVGAFSTLLMQLKLTIGEDVVIRFKEHPTNQHYQGIEESRAWLFPEVKGNFSSFFAYWKKCERYLK